nr:MAG TPA: hypothetical protein [Caudoviricetes sp.]DAY65498.1 MAG TPA: hypothetical protein [Caudoviricetes sp.]
MYIVCILCVYFSLKNGYFIEYLFDIKCPF